MRFRLTPLQLNEVDLLLAGAYGTATRYELPGDDDMIATLAVAGYDGSGRVELLDVENTPVAAVTVDAVREVDGVVWLAGVVEPRAPFAPGALDERGPRHRPDTRHEHGVLVLGRASDVAVPTGACAVVGDFGDPAQLTATMTELAGLGLEVYVLPVPQAAHVKDSRRSEHLQALATALYADRVEVLDSPPARGSGLVVLMTGLSGSGKSTLANAVAHELRLTGRLVTVLDGDVVRGMLSSELGFSARDRDMNVRRIGWVAARISEHGGVAIGAPIAPYAHTRAEVRAMAEAVGDSEWSKFRRHYRCANNAIARSTMRRREREKSSRSPGSATPMRCLTMPILSSTHLTWRLARLCS